MHGAFSVHLVCINMLLSAFLHLDTSYMNGLQLFLRYCTRRFTHQILSLTIHGERYNFPNAALPA